MAARATAKRTFLVAGGELEVETPLTQGWLPDRTLAVDQNGVWWFKESYEHRWRRAGALELQTTAGVETVTAYFKRG